MRFLVIDAGNNRCKFGIGDSGNPFPENSVVTCDNSIVDQKLQNLDEFDVCFVASVNDETSKKIRKEFQPQLAPDKLIDLSAANSPIELNVNQPDKLGPDRIAAALGAFSRFSVGTIVVDAGTATTIDWVDDQGVFQGGAIVPGIELGLKSLEMLTDRLPKVEIGTSTPAVLGKDTVSAIRSGIFWSAVGGIRLIVSRLREQTGVTNVVFSGGNGQRLLEACEIENAVYAKSLVLEGLWQFGMELTCNDET